MLKTLYGKLSAVLFGLFLVVGVLYILSTLFTTRLYLQEVNQRLNETLAQNLISQEILMESGQINQEGLQKIFHMLMVINPSIEVYLLNLEGKILAYSAPPGKVKRESVSLDPVARYLGKKTAFPILGDDPRDLNRQKIFSAAPISGQGSLQGYLYVILAGEEYDSAAQMIQGSYILRLSSMTIAGGLAFVLFAGLIFFYLLTRRLRRLSASMEKFSGSDFSEPLNAVSAVHSASTAPPTLKDEIDRLESTFVRMADRILDQMKTLQQTDALRRELVANVSHDLRTPLASLQGYIETLLLKEGKLTPEEQKAYLETAACHGERLSKLVSELFELAKLDAHEVQPHFEPFSLGELVQDVTQKFHLSSEKKQIRLQTHFRADLPFVRADIGLIERALDNLLDNALRYTPQGGTVTLSIDQENRQETGKLVVRVSDTGCGIPPDEIPRIFDRFYRVQRNTPGETQGAGLGLAITRRIVELHGSPIGVESTLHSGTTFTFSLPVYTP
ncbi:MAG: HAMP domain-containing protein [Nitrospirae bacterium]|nr:HAMP domain-containing protein [Nitrospirota bacterium]